jgi:hypothetical protein
LLKKLFLVLIFLFPFNLLATDSQFLFAIRCDQKPLIDGHLDDECWKKVEPASHFTQIYPDPQKNPSFKTEVKILYDKKNIYIGIHCYDDDPSIIYKKVLRRDRDELTDSITVQLDPYVTKKEAYSFKVTSSSSLSDYFVYNEFSSNWEWNGIWDAKSSIVKDGWECEIEIPFSTLRVFKAQSLEMGFQVSRTIARLKELDSLFYIPPTDRRNVSGFGVIKGIGDVDSDGRGDFYPFIVLKDRVHTRENFYKRGASFDVGLDFNYPLSSRFSLTGTLNPDFGQVEQDSAVLNLSTYETFFPENRPFFLEGFQIFNPPKTSYSGATFLYTRRIGSAPEEPFSDVGHKIIKAPENTTILGALKLTGTTDSRLNIAGFAAVTQSERADYADTNGRVDREILKRQTFFGAFRANLNFGINSSVGILQTFKDEVGGRQAMLNAITGDFHSKENIHNFSFNISSTNIEENGEKIYGTSFEGEYIEKISKEWTLSVSYIAHPKDYDPNDMGYLKRNDEYKVVTTVGKDTVEPGKIFNQTSIEIFHWYGKNGKGLILTRGGELDLWGELLNHYTIYCGLSVEFPYFDDREPRTDDMAIYRKREIVSWAGFSSDSRKSFRIGQQLSYAKEQKGSGFGSNTDISWRFSDRCNLTQSLIYSQDNGLFLYAGMSDDEIYPLFAKVKARQVNLTTRFSYTFTPLLTFDLYSQLFTANGVYSDFKKLLSATKFAEAKPTYNPNFKMSTNNITAVLRWEFKPASTLYAVFSHGQQGFIDYDLREKNAGMSLRREFTILTSAPRDDLFLIKVSYHF